MSLKDFNTKRDIDAYLKAAEESESITDFNEEKHEYKLNGFKVPSVTQIIGTVFGSKPWYSDYYANKGSALHKAIEYLSVGELDESSVDHRISGKLNAYRKFRQDFPSYKINSIEKYLISKKLMYGGKPDVIFNDLNKEKVTNTWILADYKSSFDFAVYLQLAGYRLLLRENKYIKIDKCLVVILNDNASYKLKWIQKKDFFKHEQIFLSCLNIYNFIKQNNG